MRVFRSGEKDKVREKLVEDEISERMIHCVTQDEVEERTAETERRRRESSRSGLRGKRVGMVYQGVERGGLFVGGIAELGFERRSAGGLRRGTVKT